MHKRISPAQEQALREQLRREAMEAWPAYSETLHKRIISAVKRRRMQEAVVSSRAPTAVRRQAGLAAVFAAACLLCAVVLGWRLMPRGPQQDIMEGNPPIAASDPLKSSSPPAAVEATIAGLPPIDELAGSTMAKLNGLIVSAVVAPQSANLKHDTRLAAEMLIERLPVDVELIAGR